jgi:N-acetylneuraminic acid mutarotase
VEGKAYVCFGRTGWNTGLLKDVWEYDCQTDNWTQKSDFPGPARVKAIAGVIGTKAYVGMGAKGAFEASNVFKDFWEYDTQTDTWTERASYPDSAANDLFCAVVDGVLYTTSGYDGLTRHKHFWKYEPLLDSWEQMPESPLEYSNKAGFSLGNSFYVGTGFRGSNMKTFFRYRTDINEWSRMSSLPEGRMLSNGLAIGDKGYVLLGRFWNGALNNGRLLSDIVEYDPASDTWTKRGDFPGGARQNAVVFAIDGKGYVLMGEDDNERKSDVWCFNP